jgi:hypothetical protein
MGPNIGSSVSVSYFNYLVGFYHYSSISLSEAKFAKRSNISAIFFPADPKKRTLYFYGCPKHREKTVFDEKTKLRTTSYTKSHVWYPNDILDLQAMQSMFWIICNEIWYYIVANRWHRSRVLRDIRPSAKFSATRKCDFWEKQEIISLRAITSGASKNLLTPLFGENGEIWRWILQFGE